MNSRKSDRSVFAQTVWPCCRLLAVKSAVNRRTFSPPRAPGEEANGRLKLRCLLLNIGYCLIVIHPVGIQSTDQALHDTIPTACMQFPTFNNIQPAQQAVRLQDCKTARRPGALSQGISGSARSSGAPGAPGAPGQLQCGAHPDWHSSFSLWA